jgi:hypothetical protein
MPYKRKLFYIGSELLEMEKPIDPLNIIVKALSEVKRRKHRGRR